MTSLAPEPTPPALTIEPDPLDRAPRESSWAERVLWTMVGVVLINWAVDLLGSGTTFWWAGLLTVFGGAWGLAVVIASLLPLGQSAEARRYANLFAWLTAGMVVLMFGAWAAVQIHNGPQYGTDELAFDQYAAKLASHGHNPYVWSMKQAFPMFRVSPNGYTYTLSGNPVLQLSYPALSFLVYVPFLLLGWSTELAAGVNVFAWMVAMLLMFAFLPRPMRAIALLVGSVSVYVAYAVGGVTDALYVPLLLVAAYRWDDFGRGRRSWLGPVALGLALAVKQTPWPLLAFVLCALAYDEYDHTGDVRAALVRSRHYLWLVACAFIIPNLPYFVASPSAWVRGTLTPLIQNLVPSGQGFIGLTLFLHLGGGSIAAFTAVTLLVGLLLLLAYVGTYPMLRPVTFLLPSLIFFFSDRSDANYLISLLPVVIVAAVTTRPPAHRRLFTEGLLRRRFARWAPPPPDLLDPVTPPARFSPRAWLLAAAGPLGPVRSRPWAAAIAITAVLFLASVVYALSAPQPLSIQIKHVRTVASLQTISEIVAEVKNNSGSSVRPAFTLQEGSTVTAPWTIAKGPHTLAAGQSASITLRTPNSPAAPSIGGGFSLVAFLDHPASISISHRYLPDRPRLAFVPQSFETPRLVGHKVTVRVQLLDHLNDSVHEANVPVYLGHLIYDSSGVKRARVSINGAPPSGKRVVALTNSQGVATFVIICNHAYSYPVTFSAGLQGNRGKLHYGNSGMMIIWFVNPPKPS